MALQHRANPTRLAHELCSRRRPICSHSVRQRSVQLCVAGGAITLCILWINTAKAIRLVGGGKLSLLYTHDGKAFRRTHPGPMPPITAHCPAGDVGYPFPSHFLVNVRMTLQNPEDI